MPVHKQKKTCIPFVVLYHIVFVMLCFLFSVILFVFCYCCSSHYLFYFLCAVAGGASEMKLQILATKCLHSESGLHTKHNTTIPVKTKNETNCLSRILLKCFDLKDSWCNMGLLSLHDCFLHIELLFAELHLFQLFSFTLLHCLSLNEIIIL